MQQQVEIRVKRGDGVMLVPITIEYGRGQAPTRDRLLANIQCLAEVAARIIGRELEGYTVHPPGHKMYGHSMSVFTITL